MIGGDSDRVAALASRTRFRKFVSVGVVGAIGDNVVLAVLGLGVGISELLAKAAGIETAILLMFLINEHWTFADEGRSSWRSFGRRLATSHLVRSGGSLLQFIIYWYLTQQLVIRLTLAGEKVWFLLASPIAIGAAMIVNYAFESLVTWRVHQSR